MPPYWAGDLGPLSAPIKDIRFAYFVFKVFFMIYFDSHCHLDLLAEKLDLVQELNKCKKSKVKRILMPGVTKNNWGRLKKIQQAYSSPACKLDYALGLHPYFMSRHQFEIDLSELESNLADDQHCIAVGEIGLDFSLPDTGASAHQNQISLFYQQLKLAKQAKLPVIIHHRKSIDKISHLVKQAHFDYGGVVHAFSGSEQQAKKLIDLGFKLGIGGTITYPRAKKTRQTIANVDAKYLLLETDAPDMPINGRQGQANSPVFIPEIFAALAHLKQWDKAELNHQLWQNTFDCFARLNR